MDNPRLIFLISLPRSGSTLLQRILAAHPDIHSVAEPWLLLPFAFLEEPWGLLAPYDHKWARHAFDDFIKTLPSGREQYNEAVRNFVLTLYRQSMGRRQKKYFLDKTPRYYFILPFIKKLFPDAKFIFLFRNPLAVFASILSTWLNNQLRIYRYYPDLYYGPPALAEGFSIMRDNSLAVQYNDLVSAPENEVRRVCEYLHIRYDAMMLSEFKNIKFDGQYGDSLGFNRYQKISTDPMEKWKSVFSTTYRKKLAKRYIRRLTDKVLSDFGTSVELLDAALRSIPTDNSGVLNDIYFHFISNAKRWLFLDYFRARLKHSSPCYKYYH